MGDSDGILSYLIISFVPKPKPEWKHWQWNRWRKKMSINLCNWCQIQTISDKLGLTINYIILLNYCCVQNVWSKGNRCIKYERKQCVLIEQCAANYLCNQSYAIVRFSELDANNEEGCHNAQHLKINPCKFHKSKSILLVWQLTSNHSNNAFDFSSFCWTVWVEADQEEVGQTEKQKLENYRLSST